MSCNEVPGLGSEKLFVARAEIYAGTERRATRFGFSKNFTSINPVTKPPMCAQTATPLDTSGRIPPVTSGSAPITCHPNHHKSTAQAGMRKKKIKKNITGFWNQSKLTSHVEERHASRGHRPGNPVPVPGSKNIPIVGIDAVSREPISL